MLVKCLNLKWKAVIFTLTSCGCNSIKIGHSAIDQITCTLAKNIYLQQITLIIKEYLKKNYYFQQSNLKDAQVSGVTINVFVGIGQFREILTIAND